MRRRLQNIVILQTDLNITQRLQGYLFIIECPIRACRYPMFYSIFCTHDVRDILNGIWNFYLEGVRVSTTMGEK